MPWANVGAASEAWTAKAEHPFFDGIGDGLNLGDVFDQTGSYTIEAEVSPLSLQNIDGTTGGGMRVLAKDPETSAGWALSIGDNSSPGRLRSFNREATNSGVVDADGIIVANAWQHIAVSFNASTQLAILYYNGVQVAQGAVDAPLTDNTTNLTIGVSDIPDRHFYGSMKNVRLWSLARTAAEILANKNKSIRSGTTGLDMQKFAWTDLAAASSSWSNI